MALQTDQIANREKGWPGKAERNSRRRSVGRPKKREIHPVAEHTHAFFGDPETHQPSLQTTRYRDQPVGMPDGPADPSPWDGEFRNDIEIAAAGGHHDRAVESSSEQHGSHAIRVGIMGVDQIEILARANLPPQNRQHRREKGERCDAHPHLGELRITRMADVQPVSNLRARGSGKIRVTTEEARREREPRCGCHNPSIHRAALDQLSQARLDKDSVLRLSHARIQR